jgi:hypothetical protein
LNGGLTERQEALTESLVARLTQLPETLQVSIMRQLSQVGFGGGVGAAAAAAACSCFASVLLHLLLLSRCAAYCRPPHCVLHWAWFESIWLRVPHCVCCHCCASPSCSLAGSQPSLHIIVSVPSLTHMPLSSLLMPPPAVLHHPSGPGQPPQRPALHLREPKLRRPSTGHGRHCKCHPAGACE